MTAIYSSGDCIFIVPKDVHEEFGDMNDWKRQVGTGPFMLTEYVAGSAFILERNDDFWMKDPIGPGEGNQLPYLDGVKLLIIPDASTRQAALRTGKIDWMRNVSTEDRDQIKKTAIEMVEKPATSNQGRGGSMALPIDRQPFSDIRVRKAMMLAVDFEGILENLYKGKGQLQTFPFSWTIEYEDLYLGLDDPEFPAETRELYTYDTEKAKQLLTEAGYPEGFKTTLLLNSTATVVGGPSHIDYYSIIKDYLSKVGIEVEFDVRESGVHSTITANREHEALAIQQSGPVGVFPTGNPVSGESAHNLSMIDDPYIEETLEQIRLACLTDQKEAMAIFKEMSKYVVEQVYAIPEVRGYTYTMWWPWLKNYSGEITIGYDDYTFPQFLWYDQELKEAMGY
jgi:peptide/nickel transport system substrate-binding protein